MQAKSKESSKHLQLKKTESVHIVDVDKTEKTIPCWTQDENEWFNKSDIIVSINPDNPTAERFTVGTVEGDCLNSKVIRGDRLVLNKTAAISSGDLVAVELNNGSEWICEFLYKKESGIHVNWSGDNKVEERVLHYSDLKHMYRVEYMVRILSRDDWEF